MTSPGDTKQIHGNTYIYLTNIVNNQYWYSTDNDCIYTNTDDAQDKIVKHIKASQELSDLKNTDISTISLDINKHLSRLNALIKKYNLLIISSVQQFKTDVMDEIKRRENIQQNGNRSRNGQAQQNAHAQAQLQQNAHAQGQAQARVQQNAQAQLQQNAHARVQSQAQVQVKQNTHAQAQGQARVQSQAQVQVKQNTHAQAQVQAHVNAHRQRNTKEPQAIAPAHGNAHRQRNTKEPHRQAHGHETYKVLYDNLPENDVINFLNILHQKHNEMKDLEKLSPGIFSGVQQEELNKFIKSMPRYYETRNTPVIKSAHKTINKKGIIHFNQYYFL